MEKERRRGESAGVADLSGRLSLTGSINVVDEKVADCPVMSFVLGLT